MSSKISIFGSLKESANDISALEKYYMSENDDVYFVKRPWTKTFQNLEEELNYRTAVLTSIRSSDIIIFVKKPDGTYGDHTLAELTYALFYAEENIIQMTHEEVMELVGEKEEEESTHHELYPYHETLDQRLHHFMDTDCISVYIRDDEGVEKGYYDGLVSGLRNDPYVYYKVRDKEVYMVHKREEISNGPINSYDIYLNN